VSEKIFTEEFQRWHHAENQHVFDDDGPNGRKPVSIPVRVDSKRVDVLNEPSGLLSGIERGKNPDQAVLGEQSD